MHMSQGLARADDASEICELPSFPRWTGACPSLGVASPTVLALEILGKEGVPGKRRFDSRLEVCGHAGSYDVTESAGRMAGADKIRINVNRQEDDFRLTARFFQSGHGLDAIEKGHGNICDDDIRIQFLCGFD
jgi:hypothetical protein